MDEVVENGEHVAAERAMVASISVRVIGSSLTPAAGLTTRERAAYRSPASTARVTSGTPVIPATVPPARAASRISAGVSKRGPSKQAYTPPSRTAMPTEEAASRISVRRAGW